MSTDTGSTSTNGQINELTDSQKHQLRHRELFLTRQNETLLATNIRGKCLVTLHNETETFFSYLNSEVRILRIEFSIFAFSSFQGCVFLSTCL